MPAEEKYTLPLGFQGVCLFFLCFFFFNVCCCYCFCSSFVSFKRGLKFLRTLYQRKHNTPFHSCLTCVLFLLIFSFLLLRLLLLLLFLFLFCVLFVSVLLLLLGVLFVWCFLEGHPCSSCWPRTDDSTYECTHTHTHTHTHTQTERAAVVTGSFSFFTDDTLTAYPVQNGQHKRRVPAN